jgi:hypothetical protein
VTLSAKIAVCRRQTNSFIYHGSWTKNGADNFLTEVKGKSSLIALSQSKGDNPNCFSGLISPLAGTPNAGFHSEDAGVCKIRHSQRQALFNRQPIRPGSSSHFP